MWVWFLRGENLFKVFPATLINGTKIPLIKGWNEAATTDPAQLTQWQEQFRDRLHFWGVPCGSVNNIIALDIDIKTNGWKTINDKNLQIPVTLSQKTLNGGTHFIFKNPVGVHVGNKVGFLPGLDIRGERGWIAWYGTDTDWTKPIADAPEWIFNEVKEVKNVELPKSSFQLAPEIAKGIFDHSLQTIRDAAPGESNNVLNIESFKIGQLVSSGAFTREFAEQELFRAAKDRGKPDYESRATIKSGLDGGLKNPLTVPFPSTEPVSPFILPPPPEIAERWTPKYLTRSDLLNSSKLRKPQLFQDWSTEDIQITTADGGTGKTTLKLYESICLALGDRFLGFECKQRGKTLYITGEDTDKKLGAMIGTIMNQMGLFSGTPENEARVDTVLQSIVIKKDVDLCLITKDKLGFLIPNRAAMNGILQAVEDIKPKMIVFDPIASFWGSESALNDMNKAVTKFMAELVDKSNACVEMINHMGKSSSANKDMSQFAGRGGSGLPSNSRVSRVLRSLSAEEFTEHTGAELIGDQTAMLCNVNKFSDGSNLFNKPFIIIREGYLFKRLTLTQAKVRELEKSMDDKERVFTYIKQQRALNKYPTRKVVIGHFMNNGDPMSQARIGRALDMLQFEGHLGEKIDQIENPNVTIKDKAIIIVDMNDREV